MLRTWRWIDTWGVRPVGHGRLENQEACIKAPSSAPILLLRTTDTLTSKAPCPSPFQSPASAPPEILPAITQRPNRKLDTLRRVQAFIKAVLCGWSRNQDSREKDWRWLKSSQFAPESDLPWHPTGIKKIQITLAGEILYSGCSKIKMYFTLGIKWCADIPSVAATTCWTPLMKSCQYMKRDGWDGLDRWPVSQTTDEFQLRPPYENPVEGISYHIPARGKKWLLKVTEIPFLNRNTAS